MIIHPCNYVSVSKLFYGTGPHPLLWAGSRAARGEIITGLRNCLNYCEIFIVYTQLRNVPEVRIIQPGAPQVGEPCIRPYSKSIPVPSFTHRNFLFNPYPTAFPYGNGMVLHFYQQQESSTTKTVHKVINKGLKTYV